MATSDLPPIDWKNRGYFRYLDPNLDAGLSPHWLQWLAALRQATKGDFSGVPTLIDLSQKTDDLVLVQSCYYLLGDAGGASEAVAIQSIAKTTNDFDLMLECCDALCARGWLIDVPILLDLYIRYASEKEASIIKVFVSDCLTSVPGELPDPADFTLLSEFREAVLMSYNKMVEELGTAKVPVFKSKLFGTLRLAKWLLHEVRSPFFRIYWRRKFEATTGIDCTGFYKSGNFQPLAAAAIVENFLESPEAAKYEDGVRYFFGHRIPD